MFPESRPCRFRLNAAGLVSRVEGDSERVVGLKRKRKEEAEKEEWIGWVEQETRRQTERGRKPNRKRKVSEGSAVVIKVNITAGSKKGKR